jgi:hypothetical protein
MLAVRRLVQRSGWWTAADGPPFVVASRPPVRRHRRTVVVYLCRGSDCRDDKLSRKRLEAHAAGIKVVKVGCQKICKAPVVGVDVGSGPRWFRRMKSTETLESLRRYLESKKLPDDLASRESKKRAGRLRT